MGIRFDGSPCKLQGGWPESLGLAYPRPMGFRDDADAARARANALQRELEEKEDELSRVRAEIEELKPGATRLVVVSGPTKVASFELDGDRVTIGRADEYDNDIALDHHSVSRHHALLFRTDDKWQIEDLQSATGVRVDGQQVRKATLTARSLIELGQIGLRVLGPSKELESTPPEKSDWAVISPYLGVNVIVQMVAILARGVAIFFAP